MAGQVKDDTFMFSYKALELERLPRRSASMSHPMIPSYRNGDYLIPQIGPTTNIERAPQIEDTDPQCCAGMFNKITGPNDREQGDTSYVMMSEEIGVKDHSFPKHARRNELLSKSGIFGVCGDSKCIYCSTSYIFGRSKHRSSCLDSKMNNILNEDAKGWASNLSSYFGSLFPITNPDAKVVHWWSRLFLISCLVSIFIDPLFFFVISTQLDGKCMTYNWRAAKTIAVLRSATDLIYFLHMLLQFRLAYIAPESQVVGTGDFVGEPKNIALNYLRSYFIVDVCAIFPLPQVMILVVIPRYIGPAVANYAKNMLRASILLQCIPRTVRFIPLLAGQSASGFLFESAWASFVINLLLFLMGGHVVGSFWYLFGLQRLNQCLHDACLHTGIPSCNLFMDCGVGNYSQIFSQKPSWQDWLNDGNSTNCYSSLGNFTFGLYQRTTLLTAEHSIFRRYLYSLMWGYLQISTFAGNQIPSYFEGEVVFLLTIIASGLLLFAFLMGNIQNFFQELGRRTLEMQLMRRDVEKWMSHRRLPKEVKRKVRQAARFSWASTRGVNEKELLENFPENLQREIRRHFFMFLKKVRIFSLMSEPMLDAVYEKLQLQLFIKGMDIIYQGGPIKQMVFIVRGKLQSIGADGNTAPLQEGDVCGEELLAWCLEHSPVSGDGGKIGFPGQSPFSNRTVKCLSNVEAYALLAADLEQVTASFTRCLRNPRLQVAIRYESPYWRTIAATRIQVAWRYRKRRWKRTDSYGQALTRSITYAWIDLVKQRKTMADG